MLPQIIAIPETVQQAHNNNPVSEIMDIRHQSSDMCVIVNWKTHTSFPTEVGNPTPDTVPVTIRYNDNYL